MKIKPKRVLVVDDDLTILENLSTRLINEGLEVLKAKDGKEGLDKAVLEKPDLIVLDILMPVMDGIEMLTELRKDKWGEEAKVVILTKQGYYENLSTATSLNVLGFIVKSETLNYEEVVASVKKYLSPAQKISTV